MATKKRSLATTSSDDASNGKKKDDQEQIDDQRLIVRGLPFLNTVEEITQELKKAIGKTPIENVWIPLKPNGRTKGFGFLKFQDAAQAQKAKDRLSSVRLFDRDVSVGFALANDKYATPEAAIPAKKKEEKKGEPKKKKAKTTSKGKEEDGEDGDEADEDDGEEIDEDEAEERRQKRLEQKEKKQDQKKKKSIAKLSRKEIKLAVMKYNQVIIEHGIRKEFTQAMKAFVRLRRRGLQPTVYTYSNIINACVRCGEIDKALSLLKTMKQDNVEANEVVYTVAIKGATQSGRMEEAAQLLDEITKNSIIPNLRTFNTLLRGCLRWGEVEMAESVYEIMEQMLMEPDLSTFEYVIKSYCQAIQNENAWNTIKKMQTMEVEPNAGIYAAIAVSCALVRDLEGTKKALSKAEKLISESEDNSSKPVIKDIGTKHQQTLQHKASLTMFAKLRDEQAVKDCKRVREFLKSLNHNLVKSPVPTTLEESSKVLFLPQKPKSSHLDFVELFGEKRKSLPIKLEVCSGHGDWVVEKAANDKQSNWISLEMRHDRVYNIWSKMIFNDVDNLVVLRGEAYSVVHECIPDRSIDEIYINFPDPPVWKGSRQRLLSKEFLKEIHRVLKRTSSVIIVTDDQPYAKMICEDFSKLTSLFVSAFGQPFMSGLLPNYGTSYFDELWKKGARTKRYTLQYQRLKGPDEESDGDDDEEGGGGVSIDQFASDDEDDNISKKTTSGSKKRGRDEEFDLLASLTRK